MHGGSLQGARPGAAVPGACQLLPHRHLRHLFAALELGEDKLYGHIKPRKTRFLVFCRSLRSLHLASDRIAIICHNFSPHLSTRGISLWRTPVRRGNHPGA